MKKSIAGNQDTLKWKLLLTNIKFLKYIVLFELNKAKCVEYEKRISWLLKEIDEWKKKSSYYED
jgi:hypothetical protein